MDFENYSFGEHLRIAMELNEVNGNQLVQRLAEAGVNINKGQISLYRREIRSPRYEMASAIFDVLGYQLEPEELTAALELQRLRVLEHSQDSPEQYSGSRVIRIRLKGLIPDKSSITIEQLLNKRIREEYGDASLISEYVHSLISEDLKNYLEMKEEPNDEGNSNH